MADFKSLTVQALRVLARRMLGPGYSRLKTKTELVDALEAADRKVAGAAAKVRDATERAARATAKAAARMGEVVREAAGGVKSAAKEEVVVKAATTTPSRSPSSGRSLGPAPTPAPAKPASAKGPASAKAAPASAPAARAKKKSSDPKRASRELDAGSAAVAGARAAVAARIAAEGSQLDPESHFVARVRGEDGLRSAPHPMTESAEPPRAPEQRAHHEVRGPYQESLGELPWTYGHDALVALPRDPKTLYLYWDYSNETLARAFAGMQDARTELWLYARRGGGEAERVRAIDFEVASRSYYVHELEPGQTYRVEVHVLDGAGRDRLLGAPSNEVQLPRFGPSSVVDDRFARIPWDRHLRRWMKDGHPGAPFPEDLRAQLARLSDWSRFAGTVWGSGSGMGGGVNAGGMGGRPFSPFSAPGA